MSDDDIIKDAASLADWDIIAEGQEECAAHCGYVSSGRDLLEHQKHEHVPCPECGCKPHGEYAVSHKRDCPRLQPDYQYPRTEASGE